MQSVLFATYPAGLLQDCVDDEAFPYPSPSASAYQMLAFCWKTEAEPFMLRLHPVVLFVATMVMVPFPVMLAEMGDPVPETTAAEPVAVKRKS